MLMKKETRTINNWYGKAKEIRYQMIKEGALAASPNESMEIQNRRDLLSLSLPIYSVIR